MSMVALNGAFDLDQTHDTDILHSMAESEFKHAPSVSFDEIDYRNEVDLKKAQESMLKEQFVKIEVVKIVRKALENCFKVNGPNGYEDCREIADKYMALLPESRAQGYLGYQRNDPTK